MEYLTLPKTNLEISRMGFGSWYSYSDKSFKELLLRAIDLGITLIDTAESYGNGNAELQIGQALKGKRNQVKLASKFSHHHSTPTLIRKSLEKSLRRLNTDYLDLYMQHWPSPIEPPTRTIEALLELKEEGKVKAIGVSNWGLEQFNQTDLAGELDFCQICYNPLWQPKPELLQLLKENQIAILCYSPLCQGILSSSTVERTHARERNIFLHEDFSEQLFTIRKAVEEISVQNQISISQLLLRWLLDRDATCCPVFGASSVEQLEANVGTLKCSANKKDLSSIDKLVTDLFPINDSIKSLWDWSP